MSVVFVDGWFGPEPEDRQTTWSRRLPDAVRVKQDDWEVPVREDWVARLKIGEVGHLTGAYGPWPAGEPLLAAVGAELSLPN